MTDLNALHVEYQTLLELHRVDPDDEHIWELYLKAKAAMEIAWLIAAAERTG